MVERVDFSGNPISGATWDEELNDYDGGWENGDSNLLGITELCRAFPSSQVKELVISSCSLGSKSITILASTLSTAVVEAVDVSDNRFDPALMND